MRQTIIRWGLGMGAVATGLGIISLLIGLALTSFQKPGMDPTQLVIVILVRAIVRLLFLGMAAGLAYYAGFRVERERVSARADAVAPDGEQNRLDAVLVGGLVMFCDWAVQTIFIYMTGMSGAQPNFFSFLGSQAILGAICVLFGAGLGGLGARDEATRGLLRKLALTPAPTTAPTDSAPRTSAPDAGAPLPTTDAGRDAFGREDGHSEAAPAE